MFQLNEILWMCIKLVRTRLQHYVKIYGRFDSADFINFDFRVIIWFFQTTAAYFQSIKIHDIFLFCQKIIQCGISRIF